MGVSQNQGYLVGFPVKDYHILGSILGSPYLCMQSGTLQANLRLEKIEVRDENERIMGGCAQSPRPKILIPQDCRRQLFQVTYHRRSTGLKDCTVEQGDGSPLYNITEQCREIGTKKYSEHWRLIGQSRFGHTV